MWWGRAAEISGRQSKGGSIQHNVAVDVPQAHALHALEPGTQIAGAQQHIAPPHDEQIAVEMALHQRALQVSAGAPTVARAQQIKGSQAGDDLGRGGHHKRFGGVHCYHGRTALDRLNVDAKAAQRQATGSKTGTQAFGQLALHIQRFVDGLRAAPRQARRQDRGPRQALG